jgi:flagellar hook-associated protein 2
MATISSAGVGSGLDINSLVSQLVAAERAAPDKRNVAEDGRLTTEFTALAQLKGALSGFQSALAGLKTSSGFDPRTAKVGDESYFTATASSAAAAGHYDVEVQRLATAARIGSDVFTGGPDSLVGTGTLTITVGGKSFDVAITQDNNKLSQVRDAINSATGNTSVRATLIRDTAGTGSYLVLSGTTTGDANNITISAANTDAQFDQFVQGLQAADAARDVQAHDAIVFVSGYEIHSATNSVSGAIDGVTLNLKKAEIGKLVSLDVSRDDAAIQTKAQAFVNSYNTLAQQIATLSRYDAATKTAGPMLGDAMLRGLDTQLRRMLSSAVPGTSGPYTTLASIGITSTVNGTLQLDATRLGNALAADASAVGKVFASESGVAVRMADFVAQKLSSSGEIAARNDGIAAQRKNLQSRADALNARMQVLQERYMKQFTAMDAMLSQLQSTSSYLTQQLSGLQNLNKS